MKSSADISACGRYRYTLTRVWGESENPRLICFTALNPSTADATVNDPTIRKEIAFTQMWAKDNLLGTPEGLLKTNLYPWRETSPSKPFLASKDHDILGPSMEEIVNRIIQHGCASVICCWGTNSNKQLAARIASRGQQFIEAANKNCLRLYCLGTNQDGSPKHPLYLPIKTILRPFATHLTEVV